MVLPPFCFANSQQGVAQFVARLKQLNAPLRIALEATSHYWLSLYEALIAQGYSVTVFNPLQIKAYR